MFWCTVCLPGLAASDKSSCPWEAPSFWTWERRLGTGRGRGVGLRPEAASVLCHRHSRGRGGGGGGIWQGKK